MSKGYTELIDQGWCPVWTGLTDPSQRESVLVRLGKDDKRIWCQTPIPELDVSRFRHLVKRTAEQPGSQLHVYPPHGPQSVLRTASIAGIGPYSSLGFGIGVPTQEPSVRRIVGLDIEQSTLYRNGNFPLHHDPIISIAITTWDKRYFCRYSTGFHRVDEFRASLTYVRSKENIADLMTKGLELHQHCYLCMKLAIVNSAN